jgi:opacity protein-like surface antigen
MSLRVWSLIVGLAFHAAVPSVVEGAVEQDEVASVVVAEETPRWLYWVDLGANFTGKLDLELPVGLNVDPEVSLNPGVRIDLGAGYRPLPWLRVGVETGYVWNSMESVLGYDAEDGQFSQVPIQALVAIDRPLWGPLGFTVGAGAGGVYTRADSGSTPLWRRVGSDQFVAGYQGFAGLTYALGRRMEVGLHYRLAVTDQLDWDLEYWGGGIQTTRTEAVLNHGISVLFRADF